MSPQQVPASTDENKTREQLLSELRELRGRVVRLENAEAKGKDAVEALRESEEKFRQMAENIGEVLFIFSPDWKRTIYVSPAYERVWGRSRNDVYDDALAWLEGVHPDDRELPLAVINRHIAGNISDTDSSEFRVLRPDGTVRWILARTYPVRGEKGEICRITGIAEDVTERKRIEREFQLAQFSVEKASDEVFWMESDGRASYVNEAACRVLGYPREDLQGMYVWDFDPEFSREKWRDYFNNLREKGFQNFETLHKTRDGRVFPVEITANYIEYEGKEYSFAFVRDITDRKMAEEAVQYSSEFNRSTLDSLPMNIVVLDGAGTIVFANRAWMEFGRENDIGKMDSIGVGANYLEVCRLAKGDYSDEAHTALEGMSAVLNGDRDTFEMEYPCHSPDKKRWFTMRVTPIKASKFHGIIVTHTDITLRKLFEEAIAAEKARAELYLDLMGHDINNMHQVALGYLELARDLPHGEDRAAFLDKPMEVLQRSTRLIQNVRKLQKLQEGVFQTREVDVCDTVRDVQREFGAIPNKTITLNLNQNGQCMVRANELLHDVFANLVNNAIKHTGDRADILIDLDILKEKGKKYCRVIIEDDGPGIPDDFKSIIFNRALRGTSKARGMGLGLYLVKSLVESYGGRVWAEDRVKGDHTRGARFVVMLPMVEK